MDKFSPDALARRGLRVVREGVPAVGADRGTLGSRLPAEVVGDGATYDDGDVTVENPALDRTPARLVAGVATEAGVLDADEVREVAERHREYAAWDDAGAEAGANGPTGADGGGAADDGAE